MLEKNSSCVDPHYVLLIDEIMHTLFNALGWFSDYFTTMILKESATNIW
jgi:hypothetical protein